MDYISLGQNIQKRRKAIRITQERLAEQIGLTTAYISQIETGARKPSLETVVTIAEKLSTSVDSLIGNKGNRYVLTGEIAQMLARLSCSELVLAKNILREVFLFIDQIEARGDARALPSPDS